MVNASVTLTAIGNSSGTSLVLSCSTLNVLLSVLVVVYWMLSNETDTLYNPSCVGVYVYVNVPSASVSTSNDSSFTVKVIVSVIPVWLELIIRLPLISTGTNTLESAMSFNVMDTSGFITLIESVDSVDLMIVSPSVSVV